MPKDSDQSDERDVDRPFAEQPKPEAQGDDRGEYGFGRPAHGSDPRNSYGFDLTLQPAHTDRRDPDAQPKP